MADPGVVEVLIKGLAAGVAGTAAMTASEKIEQSITGREDSMVTAEVGAMVAKPPIETGAQAQKLGQVVHWMHGVTWGAVRGLLALTPLNAFTASALHYASLWTSDALLYRVLKIEPLPHQWEKQALVIDLFHKLVLSAVTSLVFLALLEV
ncbi:MAG: hypothetical protein M3198_00525 [Actinomycetota bacterium]|nr:hypothetical protein [Actinomycetota bacterium]